MVFDKRKTDDSIGLEVGAEAPDFTAPLVRPNGNTESVGLSALLEEAPVLLAFYTNDFSPDCVTEWCSFRDDAWFDASDHIQVIGISRSRAYTHRRFMEYLDLPFPLYSDTDLAITEAYGVRYVSSNFSLGHVDRVFSSIRNVEFSTRGLPNIHLTQPEIPLRCVKFGQQSRKNWMNPGSSSDETLTREVRENNRNTENNDNFWSHERSYWREISV
jgi:peroxiredoxin